MQFRRGMRDKLEKYFDVQKDLEVVLEISGTAEYDFCCFGVDERNQLSDDRYMIFYNQLQAPNGEIVLEQKSKKGIFKVNLERLPSEIQKLAFTVSIDGPGIMSEISSHKVILSQGSTEPVTLELTGEDFLREKSVISVEIYRKNGWRAAAVANGFNGGLPALLEQFGGVEESASGVLGDIDDSKTAEPAAEQKEVSEIKERGQNDAVKVFLRYDSQMVQSEIFIDGEIIEPQNPLYRFREQNIFKWADQLLPILKEVCNDNSFWIDFDGLQQDYEDFSGIINKYCKEHPEFEVYWNFAGKAAGQSEVLNRKEGREEALVQVTFRYNPYTVQSEICINGEKVEPQNSLGSFLDKRMQEWADQLLPVLKEVCNDNNFQIDFYGLRMDYDDLAEIIKDYCTEHPEFEVHLNFTEAKGSEDRLEELKKLFYEMQKDCPFEDLKTEQIRENFELAIGSEFEVSVIATMSSGKSTLINSLLGTELMPSKNEACTATIARIKDNNTGHDFRAVYRDKENHILGEYEHLSLTDMEEMNANPDTAYIDIEGNIPNIDSSGIKLVLVDTPGPNNSRTEDHKNHTYKVIKEKTKPMVLYVLNATQLQTNDDHELLGVVSNAMKVGGKQSKDRFLFAVNKIDLFDPDKESVEGALNHVREYLKKFDIVNPNIFPTSAETAKVIRMKQNGEHLTKGQMKVLSNCNFFIEEEQLHLSEQAGLSQNNMRLVKKAIEEARQNDDIYQEVLIHTGIPAVEIAINEYLKKYAYTAKIKSAVDTFKKKIEEKNMQKNMLEAINANEKSRKEINSQLNSVRQMLEEGDEAKKFRDKIEALDMMKDAKNKIRKIRAKITKELNPSDNKGAMTTLEVQQLMMKMNHSVEHLQSDVKTELDNIIQDVIVDNANTIMNEYKEHIHSLIQSGAVAKSDYSFMDKGCSIDFLEVDIPNAQEIINSYKYEEEYDTGEREWVENTSKRWYKPWTWFQDSGHYRTIYANREMVDYSEVENEYLTPIIQRFNENLAGAQNAAQKEAEKFKAFFLEQLSELESALKKKVEENEKLTQSQSNIDAELERQKEHVKWLENFLERLDAVVEI